MRDERRGPRPWRNLAWLVACGAALPAPAAAATPGLMGSLQVQYQDVDQRLTMLNPDGTTSVVNLSRQAWVQSYEASQSARWGQSLNLFAQLRLNDVSYPGLPDHSRTPYGTLRLVHPLAGFIGSYSPSTTTGSFGGGVTGVLGSQVPAGTSLTFTTRTQETLLSGYVAPPRLPRIDLSWTRHHQEADLFARPQTGTNRRASLNYDLGTLNVHGSYADQFRDDLGAGSSLLQRSYSGGSSAHLAVGRRVGLQLQYDYAQTGRTLADQTRSHSGTVTGDLFRTRVSDWALFYAVRRTVSMAAPAGGDLTDHEGSLMYSRQLSRLAKLTAGGGARTDRSVNPTGNDLLRYGTAVVSFDGDLRPGWHGLGSLSHSSNWQPGHAPYSIEGYHVGTRMRLRPGLEVEGDYNLGTNTDTLVRSIRAVRQASLGLRLTPRRSLTATVGVHAYQAGPGIFLTEANSRAASLDLDWRPVPTLELAANATQSGALPHNDPRSTTQLYTVRWSPGQALQLWGTYSSSNQVRRDITSTSLLSGHDVLSARLLANLSRSWNVSAGYNVADRGQPDQSRQVDAAVTKSFGR